MVLRGTFVSEDDSIDDRENLCCYDASKLAQ